MTKPWLRGNSVRFVVTFVKPSITVMVSNCRRQIKDTVDTIPQNVGSMSSTNGPRGDGKAIWKCAFTNTAQTRETSVGNMVFMINYVLSVGLIRIENVWCMLL